MARMFMWVLWPSFLVAAIAVGAFFSVFDPQDLPWLGGTAALSPQAAHTVGFFFFWSIGALAATFTLILSHLAGERAAGARASDGSDHQPS